MMADLYFGADSSKQGDLNKANTAKSGTGTGKVDKTLVDGDSKAFGTGIVAAGSKNGGLAKLPECDYPDGHGEDEGK